LCDESLLGAAKFAAVQAMAYRIWFWKTGVMPINLPARPFPPLRSASAGAGPRSTFASRVTGTDGRDKPVCWLIEWFAAP